MRQREALLLHNGDEVTVKETGTVAVVLSVVRLGRLALLDVTGAGGYRQLAHFEVK